MSIALLCVFIARLLMAINRYFDPDEFAHMHWAFLMVSGSLPYKDFFFYITPMFQWVLAPLFLLPQSEVTMIYARLLMLVFYVGSALLVFILGKKSSRSSLGGLLGTLLYAVFPMTIDKTIDIRPDIIMVITMLSPAIILLSSKRPRGIHALFAGILLGISFTTLFKMVYILPALLWLLVTLHPSARAKTLFFGIVGFSLPILGIIAWYGSGNLLPLAWQAFTHDQFAVNFGKQSFSILKTLSPWPLVYVTNAGPSIPWGLTVAIWALSLPGFLLLSIKNLRSGIFLTLFFAAGIGFLLVFPVPYVQYFMPLSVPASIAAGYFIIWGIQKLSSVAAFAGSFLFLVVISGIGASCWIQFQERGTPTVMIQEQKQAITDILAITKPDETIYDMTGSYVFRPDGYFICCHPYGEFVDRLASPPGTLAASLLSKQTKFLVMDQKGYVFWLPKPSDLSFLLSTYTDSAYKKIYTAGVTYVCNEGKCHQIDIFNNPVAGTNETKTLRITYPERYILRTTPPGGFIILNHLKISDGQSLPLSPNLYSLEPSPSITKFILRIDR